MSEEEEKEARGTWAEHKAWTGNERPENEEAKKSAEKFLTDSPEFSLSPWLTIFNEKAAGIDFESTRIAEEVFKKHGFSRVTGNEKLSELVIGEYMERLKENAKMGLSGKELEDDLAFFLKNWHW